MANYRRFVTYFYDYSTGNKSGICGFGKIEYSMRSRVHITIQGKRTGREECVVYGLSGNEEVNQILGKMMLNYGKGSFLWEWNGKEKSADLFVRNMVGIVIVLRNSANQSTEQVLAATRWDGAEFDLKRFFHEIQSVKSTDKVECHEESARETQESSHEEKCKEMQQNVQIESCEEQKPSLQKEGCEEEQKSLQMECCEQKQESSQVETCEDGQESSKKQCCEEAIHSNITNQDNNMIWNQLCHKYARFMPFPQASHIQCLKIHLGDLRRFSGENRRLANNNFLLRGYYRCHYIVLSKWEMEDGAQYYIGIPGIYQEREANLAGHFGFCVFAPFKGGEASNGKCGLWMTPLNLAEERA